MASNSVENAQGAEPNLLPDEQKPSRNRLAEDGLDKTVADSFPSSDPPSSIPDPGDQGQRSRHSHHKFSRLAPGTWVALSLEDDTVIATASTREEAEAKARRQGQGNFELVSVPQSGAA
jgi:hypothetical protein